MNGGCQREAEAVPAGARFRLAGWALRSRRLEPTSTSPTRCPPLSKGCRSKWRCGSMTARERYQVSCVCALPASGA